MVDDHVRNYLNKQREFRKEDSNRKRQEMASKFADKVMEESVKLLKRKRTATPPNKSPTDKRATKKAAKRAEEEPSLTRQLFEDSDVEESSDDEEIKEEKRLRKLNAGIKKVYTDDINSYKSLYANNLYESTRHRLAKLSSNAKAKNILKTMLLNHQESIK